MRALVVTAARPEAPRGVSRRGLAAMWPVQLAFLVIHAPLALAIPKHSRLGELHALAVFGLGLIAALVPRRPYLVACVAAYITGAATFWRMKAAPQLPWEFGKYAIIAVLGVALVFSVRIRRPALPIAYVALLLPSAYLTITSSNWDDARAMLSFNLSGPAALAVSVLFFSSVRLSPSQLRWVLISVVAPVVAIATTAARSLDIALQDPEFEFYGGSSNAAASGGFGANQVSAALGLGLVAIALYLLLGRTKRFMTAAMLLLLLFFARQCLVTLSRGGIYMFAGAIAAASLYLLRDKASRRKLVVGGVAVGVVIVFVVIPRLQAVTGGVLVSRFENTGATGRDLLIKADLQSWSQNPLLGVGPGLGEANRLRYFHAGAAHTEYSRIVAEHGFLGFVSLVLLVAMAARCIREQQSLAGRAVSAALLAYAFLFMAVDATRLVAPSFAFGLASMTLAVPRRRRRLERVRAPLLVTPRAARAS